MMITGPGDEDENDAEETAAPGDAPPQAPVPVTGEVGDPGLTVRIIDGRPTITRVQTGSTAEHLGLRPGFIVTAIAGRPLAPRHASARALRPIEERFALRRAAARRLAGPPGTRVTLNYLDDQDRPGKVVLTRDPPRGPSVQLGYLPPLYPEVRAYEIGDVGVVAFNVFILDPVLNDVNRIYSSIFRASTEFFAITAPGFFLFRETRWWMSGLNDSSRHAEAGPSSDAFERGGAVQVHAALDSLPVLLYSSTLSTAPTSASPGCKWSMSCTSWMNSSTGRGQRFLHRLSLLRGAEQLDPGRWPRKWMSRIMITWGIVTAFMMFVTGPWSFYPPHPAGRGGGGLLPRHDPVPELLVPDSRRRSRGS